MLLVRWIDSWILIGQRGFANLAKSLGLLTKSISGIFTRGQTGFAKVRYVEDLEGLKVEKLLEPTDFHFAVDGRWLRWRYGNTLSGNMNLPSLVIQKPSGTCCLRSDRSVQVDFDHGISCSTRSLIGNCASSN